MKRMMQRRLPLCTQIIGLICLLPLVCCQHDLCVRPSSCDYGAVLPDPDDCQSYYECTDRRRWEHQTCHNSELFDVVKMACIKKNQAVCVDCDATTPTVVDSTVACAPPIPCVLDSVLGNPLSCTSYQMCFTANNWKVFDCPSGLYFDIISYQCIRGNEEYTCQPTCESVTRDYDPRDMNNENEASTASQIRTIEPALLETACNIVPGGTCSLLTFGAHSYPDVHDCENFYLCTDTWESFSCNSLPGDEGPYYYDAVSMACRQTTEAITCAAPCTTTIPTTTRSTGPTIDPDILEQACSAYDGAPCNRNAAYLPNPVDCGSFFICLVTAWKKISCPPGQLFDALSDEGCGEVDEVICSPPCPGMTTENTFTTAASTSTTSTTISTLLPTTTTSSYPHTSTEILTTEGLLTSSSGEYSSSNPPFTIGEITHEQTGNPTIAAHKQDTTTVADTTSGEPTTHPDTTSTAAITSTTSTIQQSTTSFQPTVQLSTLSSSAIQPDATPDASTPFQTPLPSTSSEYETTDYPTTTSLSTAIPSFTSEETSRPSITTNHDSTSPLFSTETTPEPEFTTFKPPTHVPHSTTKSTLPSIMTTSDIRSSEPYSSTTVMIGGEETSHTSFSSAWPELTTILGAASTAVTSDSHHVSADATTAVVPNASQSISSMTDNTTEYSSTPTHDPPTTGIQDDDTTTTVPNAISKVEMDQPVTSKGHDATTHIITEITTADVSLKTQSTNLIDDPTTEGYLASTRFQPFTTASPTIKVESQSTTGLTSSVPDVKSTYDAAVSSVTTSESAPTSGENGLNTDLLSQTTTGSSSTEDMYTYPPWVFTPIVEPPRTPPSRQPTLTTVLHGASETTLNIMTTRNSDLISKDSGETLATPDKSLSTMEVRDHTRPQNPDTGTTEDHSAHDHITTVSAGTTYGVVDYTTTVSAGTTMPKSDEIESTRDPTVTGFEVDSLSSTHDVLTSASPNMGSNTIGSTVDDVDPGLTTENTTSFVIFNLSSPSNPVTEEILGFCPAEVDVQSGDLVWPETTAGTVARLEVCHLGLEGYVSRKCVRTADGGAQWDDLNFGMCVDTIYQQLLDEAEHMMSSGDPTGVEVTTILELAVELAEVTANDTRAAGGMTPGNLNATVVTIVLLSDITDVGYHGDGSGSGVPEGGNTGEEIAQEVIECVSSILSPENGNGWEELLKLDPNRAVSILNIVDEVAERLAETAEPGRDISIVTNTVVVEVFPMEADETETVVFQGMTSMSPTEDPQIDTIAIPMATLANLAEEMQMDKVVVYGTYYNALGPYLPPSGDMILNSRIISLSIRDVPFGTHLNPSVQMNFTLLNKSIDDVVLMCGYWNYTSRTSGYWSSEGCTMRHHSFTQASCECNHLTNFAVLMSPYAPAPHHVKILSLITIIGCLLSITGCLATLCLYIIAWKRIASEHAAVMLNLCVVLILANGLFLAGIERTENWIACTSVAALLHYLYLTACMIMLADGIEFVLYVMYVFHVKRRKETLLLLATCYVVPATIVGISLSVTKLEGYGTDEYCWLAKENGLLGAFIGPVVVITLANFIILIKVLQTAAGSKAREHKGKFWSTIWNVTVILPLLGITWIFGIIAINEETVYFQYVFASLNSLQGFFIFIFHCALNKKLREAVVLKFSGRGSTTSSVLSGKSAKSTKSKKSIVSNLSGESDKSGKSDKKSMLSRKKKDIDAKSNKGKGKIKGSKTGTYANGDIENAVYSEYITPSRAAAQNGYVQEVSGENDLYCDIIEANMNPQNDLNKGIRRHYDKSPFSGRSDKFAKPDDRKSFERSSMTSVKSHQKKDVAEEFLIMEPEYIDDNREIHFIDNRSFFDDTANDNPYMEIDNLEDNSSVDQWTRYQISHSGDESVVQQPQHWIRYQISNDGSDPHYINGAAEHMDGVA